MEGGSPNQPAGPAAGARSLQAQALKLVADEKANRATPASNTSAVLGEVEQKSSSRYCSPGRGEKSTAGPSAPGSPSRAGARIRRRQGREDGPFALPRQTPRGPTAFRAAALDLLGGRSSSSLLLLKAIDEKKIDPRSILAGVVQKMQPALRQGGRGKLLAKHYGRVRAASAQENTGREMLRIGTVLKAGKGDAKSGREGLRRHLCAKCHKLYGKRGGDVGPELTGYERSNPIYWMENVADPGAAIIREEYVTFVIKTDTGRTLTGIVAGQDKTTVKLRDQEARLTKLSRDRHRGHGRLAGVADARGPDEQAAEGPADPRPVRVPDEQDRAVTLRPDREGGRVRIIRHARSPPSRSGLPDARAKQDDASCKRWRRCSARRSPTGSVSGPERSALSQVLADAHLDGQKAATYRGDGVRAAAQREAVAEGHVRRRWSAGWRMSSSCCIL